MRIFLGIIFILISSTIQAQTLDQSFNDWSVFRHNGSCYIASAPIKQAGNYSKRGQPYLLVVHKNAATDEINASSGYPYATKSEAIATLDGKQFKLFTQGNVSWAYDAAQDAQMVSAMKNGNAIKIRGTSPRKTWSEDTYSLNGFSAAHARMKALCR